MAGLVRNHLACLGFLLLLAVPVRAEEDPWSPRLRLGDQGEVALVGYVQSDFRSFGDWEVEEGLRAEGRDVPRRARLGVEGRWRRFAFEAQGDADDGREHLKDLWGELRFFKALRVRGGNFKLPMSGERLTSAAKTDFIERSLAVNALAPDRDWGVMAYGEPARLVQYQAGIFRGDGRRAEARAGTTLAARLLLSPARRLDLGVAFASGDVRPDAEADADPEPRGLRVDTASGFRLFAPHFVSGHRRRLGLEAAFAAGPVGLRAELLTVREARAGQGPDCSLVAGSLTCGDLPPLVAHGFSASATWLLTGEKKQRTIRPRRPLGKGVGAVEIGLRAETIRYDDDGPDTGFAGVSNRARNVRPTGEDALTAGLSWWPWSWTRVLANVVLERFDDPLLAPEPGRRGNYVTLLTRIQLQVP